MHFWSDLEFAVSQGARAKARFFDEVKERLLESDLPNDRCRRTGESVMHALARHAPLDVLRTALDSGWSAEEYDPERRRPIEFCAGMQSDSRTVEALLEHGACPKAANNLGVTPLHEAAKNPNPMMIQVLIDAGADIAARTRQLNTPLHMACEQVSTFRTARLLIEKGADVNARRSDGATPLHMAMNAASGAQHLAALMVQDLLRGSADCSIADEKEMLPLHDAVAAHQTWETDKPDRALLTLLSLIKSNPRQWPPSPAAMGRALAIGLRSRIGVNSLRFILDHCNDESYSEAYRHGALHFAAGRFDDPRLINKLLNAGMPAGDARPQDGHTPLMEAARFDKPRSLATLLEGGAEVDSRSFDGISALGYAASWGSLGCAHILLNHNASPNLADRRGNTPMHHAAEHRSFEVYRLLESRGGDASAVNQEGQSAGQLWLVMSQYRPEPPAGVSWI